ncbi:L-alanine-DL-glutamate epimerase [Chitinophaga ginsengisegetis]|uniref:L-alanine-DL-glutamate epimerase n=1 Tax=Chitinophaga ginsengisegetis TaxID=393003 RepID=A0A1T5NFV9_9BACT|nr:mandelate racemase/muconate lactonizing enzyme family protein [Chitinophaga ginsengisegetis]MDR6571047.1 L-alanine-DL-glutamate epimerase-like enolase superfamily enzyme [Chitinophaga ginsengisegetis]MDR6650781.1 L-alanine-DL-glutamate epimerase-like enolase superfamily enzyme [Chitinophaga ginsengisegetis]MDR6657199.1 L-alanine-DL-glutamate epimerase-like enolase superfamily enzyme [Chitinophaga ginsengisegetis]SKC99029.1 L-alanine-DL-glutamate epimerase [Chitinophaga ginsengisegetis]
MKITDITTKIIRLSSELWYAPHPVPSGYIPFFDFPLTILHTDEGIEGYTMDYCPLGQGIASAYAVHDIYYHDLVGHDPLNHEAIWQRLRSKQRHLYNFRETIWGNLDVALWDIKGKVAGLPIAVLLGKYRDKVPVYSSCPPQTITTPEALEQQVRLKIAQGFKGIKLQLSGGSAQDIPKLRLAREIAGSSFPLMLDSSAVLSFEDALKIGYELDDLHYEWFEEPFPDAHILQLQKLSQAIRTPVLAGETVGLFELPNYMIQGAIDIVRGDVHHKSGITGVMKAIGMCEMMGFEFEIHTAASPLLDIANLHVACAARTTRFLESHHPMFRFGLKNNPLEIREDGCQHCPEQPGLGVEIDWDWINDHTVEEIKGRRW